MRSPWRKAVVSGLALAMMVGGASAAFADHGKGKGNGKEKHSAKEWREVIEKNFNAQRAAAPKLDISGKIDVKVQFADVKGSDVEWAARYIASLASKRVFDGFEDGTFRPRETITRVQAIKAAVQLMGLEDEAKSSKAMNANLNFKDADKLKKEHAWAVGYVAVALEHDLFAETETMIQPNKPADRLWATTLLVKAMGKQEQAKEKMNAKLPFKDANQIPAGSVGYVAVAIDNGWIDGYEDNTFRPNKPVTRAEMAALAARVDSQLPDQTSIRGKLTDTVSDGRLKLESQGDSFTVELNSFYFIFRDGKQVNVSALQKGDELLIRTYDGKAIYIEVTKLATEERRDEFTVSGKLHTFRLNSSGQVSHVTVKETNDDDSVTTSTYALSSDFAIEDGDFRDLVPGVSVELKGQNQYVHTIVIK